nr:transmembrane protein 132C-like [Paramormyrops kingsleyae]
MPPFSASLLSNTVERDWDGEKGVTFKVRALFHWQGQASRGHCVTLHAFKETEEQRATCLTQPLGGFCMVTLKLPQGWIEMGQSASSYPRQSHKSKQLHRQRYRGKRLREHASRTVPHIQLYCSSPGSVSDFKQSPACLKEKWEPSQKRLYYLGALAVGGKAWVRNLTREHLRCSNGAEEELRLDPNVLIGYQKGPVHGSQQVQVSISLMSNFTGDLVIIRMKVKKGLLSLRAQQALTSDLWAITLEMNAAPSHDTVSIICHKLNRRRGSYSPTVHQQVACLSVEGLRKHFGVVMSVTAHWWVEYSGRSYPLPPHRAVVSTFFFSDWEIVGIAPISKSRTIINTAILSSQPVSLPITVLAVSRDGDASDITAAVTCHSTNDNIVKVSANCSAIFVDGSESGVGNVCVEVKFFLGTLSGALCLTVWAPVIPLLISLSDPVLSAIEGWSSYTAMGCAPIYQRSTVQVLAQFAAKAVVNTGHLTYMLGSPDWFMDVTELVGDWLKVRDPQVACLDLQHNLIGLQPGVTSLQVISRQWDGVLASCDVTVTDDSVIPGDLSVQVVGGLGLSVYENPGHASIVSAVVRAHSTLYRHGQEASLSVWLHFSDRTAAPLAAFADAPSSLRLSALSESVVTLIAAQSHQVVARGNGEGPLLKAELLVSTCQPTSTATERQMLDLREGTAMRSLAGGSAWLRVTLDSRFRPMESEDPDSTMVGISEVLLEFDKDFSNALGDNSSQHYNGYNGSLKIEREQEVLPANHEQSGVYSSSGAGMGESESEMGVAVVLLLFVLSAFLFLVNCLPCTLRQRMRRSHRGMEADGVKGPEDEEVTPGHGS